MINNENIKNYNGSICIPDKIMPVQGEYSISDTDINFVSNDLDITIKFKDIQSANILSPSFGLSKLIKVYLKNNNDAVLLIVPNSSNILKKILRGAELISSAQFVKLSIGQNLIKWSWPFIVITLAFFSTWLSINNYNFVTSVLALVSLYYILSLPILFYISYVLKKNRTIIPITIYKRLRLIVWLVPIVGSMLSGQYIIKFLVR